MQASYLISTVLVAIFVLAACGGPSADAPASTAVPTPAVAPAAPAPAAAPAAPAPTLDQLPPPYNEASLDRGKEVFAKCRNCHSLVASEGNKVGPNLHGVFERHPGSAAKFKYSPALAGFAAQRWTPELIDHWLSNPQTFLPGNGMFFNGIGKEDDRRDVIAWLLIETRK